MRTHWKKLLLLLALTMSAYSSNAANIAVWPDSGGGGGGSADNLGNHTATQDIALGLNEIEQAPAIGFNATLTGFDTGQGASAFWRRDVESGPQAVCAAGAPNEFEACQVLAVNSAECGGSHDCVRNDGTGGTPGMVDVPVVLALDAIGPNTYSQDNIFRIGYNAGDEGVLSAPPANGQGQILWNYEFDWRAPTNTQRHEHYLQIIKAGGSASDSWRPFFWGANLDLDSATFGFTAGLHRAADTGNESRIGQFKMATFEVPATPGIRFANDETVPFGTFQIETGSNFGGQPAGSWSQKANPAHFTEGPTFTFHGTSDTTNQQDALRVTFQADGPNIFGACDANSTGASVAEGDQCITNEDCNDGDAYDSGIPNGICVKGNGTLGSGTNDGLCIVTATKTISPTTVFCDTTFEAQGTCQSGEVCRDIQEFYTLKTHAAAALIVDANAPTAGSNPAGVWGYCSSGAGGSADDEGKLCRYAADCSSNSCTFPTTGGKYINELVGTLTRISLTDSRTNNLADPLIINSTNEYANIVGSDNYFTWSGANQNILQSARTRYKAPTITQTGGTSFNEYVIRIENQWEADAQYTPILFGWDALTKKNSGIFQAISGATAGWDTGNIRLGRVYLWSSAEGTSPESVDNLRISFNASPSSATAGQAVAVHSLSNNHGIMKWGVSDASGSANFDTGTEVCAASGQTCVDSDVMGSDGSATTCATSHANAANFWAFCRD